MHGALQNYSDRLPSDPFLLEDAESGWESILALNPSARVALSAALHDLVGKRLGIPVYRLWGLDPAKAPRSTFTIGIDNDAKLRQKVKEAEQYPILKIKLGTDRDVEILETIRGMTQKELRVDANCGWTRQAGDPHAPGAGGIRGDGAGAALAGGGSGRTGPGEPSVADPGDRRRELQDRGRHSSRWWARWTASISSWPSAAAFGKRCA